MGEEVSRNYFLTLLLLHVIINDDKLFCCESETAKSVNDTILHHFIM